MENVDLATNVDILTRREKRNFQKTYKNFKVFEQDKTIRLYNVSHYIL